MKETITLIMKGIMIGIGKIIPGVSGGMMAISLNVYDKSINAISNFFKDIRNNFLFLFKLGMGIMIAIILFSKLINYALFNFYLPTMFLFIGLIIGGIPNILKEVKKEVNLNNINLMLIPIIFILLIAILSSHLKVNNVTHGNVLILGLLGIIEALTMIIPGISGTMVLMMLGYYNLIIEAFSNLTRIDLFISSLEILCPFGIGIFLGIIFLAKIIDKLLSKYRIKCFYIILGFTISSIGLLLLNILKNNYSLNSLILNLVFLGIGFIIGKYFD